MDDDVQKQHTNVLYAHLHDVRSQGATSGDQRGEGVVGMPCCGACEKWEGARVAISACWERGKLQCRPTQYSDARLEEGRGCTQCMLGAGLAKSLAISAL